MNLTISLKKELLEQARRQALDEGRSLQDVIREFLRAYVREVSRAGIVQELHALADEHPGHSGGRGWSREDAYDPKRIGLQ